MRFSMSRTWGEALALVVGRWLDLLLLALAVHVIVALVMLPMMSQWIEMVQVGAGSADPAVEFQRVMESMQRLMGMSLLANLLQLVGYGSMVALLSPDRPSIGKALIEALKATPTMLLAIIFLIAGMYIAMIVVVLAALAVIAAIAGTAALAPTTSSTAVIGPAVLVFFALYIGMIVAVLYVMLRFVTLIPVAVIERQRNPFTVLSRSWALTRRDGWRILGFWVLMWIPLMAIYMAIALTFMAGLFTADGRIPPDVNFVALFAALIPLGILLGMFLSAVVVSTHRQLTEEVPAEAASET